MARCKYGCASITCIVCAVFWFITCLTLLCIIYAAQSYRPEISCYDAKAETRPIIYLHRGNATFAQENTQDAALRGIAASYWSEIDVSTSSDGTPYLFHDANIQRMTGINAEFASLSNEELDNELLLSPVIDGFDYNETRRIPRLETVMQLMCSVNNNSGAMLDVKDEDSAETVVNIVRNSGCTTRPLSDTNFIFAVGHPTPMRAYKKAMKNADADMDVITSVFLHPGAYGAVGLHFFLRTRLLHWWGKANGVSAHRTVWDSQDAELLHRYEEDGFCSGIYGVENAQEEIEKYPSLVYMNLDEKPYFSENADGQFGGDGWNGEAVTYERKPAVYAIVMTMLWLGIVLCGVCSYAAYYLRKSKHSEFANLQPAFSKLGATSTTEMVSV